jgi:hypothetical protein
MKSRFKNVFKELQGTAKFTPKFQNFPIATLSSQKDKTVKSI